MYYLPGQECKTITECNVYLAESVTGINPNVLWPSKGELDELVEIDEKWEPSFEELKQQLADKRTHETEEKEKWYVF